MVDTLRTTSYLQTTLFEDGQAAGSISPQDMRDFVVTALPLETTLTYASSLTWNLNSNPVAIVTLTGNVTITVTNGEAGKTYRLIVIQDATGGRTVALSGVTVMGSAIWQTTASGVNFLNIDMSGTTLYAFVT